MMKRTLIMVSVLICMLGLVGCDPGTNRVDGEELVKNTVKIELYNYENASPKLHSLNGKKMSSFDFSKATLISALDESHFQEVIKDIAEQDCLVFGKALIEPIGKTVILYQENGNMVVLFGCVYKNGKKLTKYYGECNVFDENGQFLEHIGRMDSGYVDSLESTYWGNIS